MSQPNELRRWAIMLNLGYGNILFTSPSVMCWHVNYMTLKYQLHDVSIMRYQGIDHITMKYGHVVSMYLSRDSKISIA